MGRKGLEGKDFENIGRVGEWKREKEFFFLFILCNDFKWEVLQERENERDWYGEKRNFVRRGR